MKIISKQQNAPPRTPNPPKAEPNALSESVTVKAGIVAVRQWMAEVKYVGVPCRLPEVAFSTVASKCELGGIVR